MITTIMIILWPTTILGWVIYNLYNKNVKLENAIVKQQRFINEILSTFKDLNKAVEQIDSKIWVQSDPELISLFDSVKEIQSKICKIKTLTIKFLSTLKISSKLACNNLHFFKSQNSTMRVLSRIIVVFKEGK